MPKCFGGIIGWMSHGYTSTLGPEAMCVMTELILNSRDMHVQLASYVIY